MGTEHDCIAWDLSAGRGDLPGGLIHRSDHWLIEHSIGPLGVGTLIVKPERHVLHVAELSDPETAELGPLLRQTTEVLGALCHPDQVYVSSGHTPADAPCTSTS